LTSSERLWVPSGAPSQTSPRTARGIFGSSLPQGAIAVVTTCYWVRCVKRLIICHSSTFISIYRHFFTIWTALMWSLSRKARPFLPLGPRPDVLIPRFRVVSHGSSVIQSHGIGGCSRQRGRRPAKPVAGEELSGRAQGNNTLLAQEGSARMGFRFHQLPVPDGRQARSSTVTDMVEVLRNNQPIWIIWVFPKQSRLFETKSYFVGDPCFLTSGLRNSA
jgi:hypothetical protein